MTEDKTAPSFGTTVERFADIGYHPKSNVLIGTHKYPKLAPGCYEWNKRRKIVSAVPSWKRQTVTAEYSRRLGFRGDHILKRNLWFKSINGPGWQDLPSGISKRSVAFATAERFPSGKVKAFAIPGPGTYGKNHVPYTKLEEKSKEKGFSFSVVPPFERTSCAPRSSNLHRTYHLPPNLYNIKPATEELISKRISKRGPYQLFSVERFPDPPPDKLTWLPVWVNPSDLNHPKNVFKGKFLKCGKNSLMTSRLVLTDLALAPKKPFDPGPNYYDPYPQPVVAQTKAPFNSSVPEVRPVVKCGLTAPPGRYNVETKRKIKGDGMKSAFLSKTKRGLPMPEKVSWFE